MSKTVLEMAWSRNPPDAMGYWLRYDDHVVPDAMGYRLRYDDHVVDDELREKVEVTLHFATDMRDGRVLIDLGRDGQPNFTDVTSPTVTCRTSHWWWYGPIPILPPE